MLINYLTEESKKIYLHRFAKYITPYRNVANLSSWGQVLRPILKSCCTTVKIHPWWNALETGQSNYAKPTNRWTVNCFPSVLFPFAVSGTQKHNIAEKRNQWNQDKFAYFQFAALGAGCGELFGLTRVCEVCPKWWKRRVPHSSLTRSVLRRRRAASLSANLSLLLS